MLCTFKVDWTLGDKSPMINFSSRTSFPLWAGREPEHPVVHIFGELDLPLHETREATLQQISELDAQSYVNALREEWDHISD